MSTCQLTPSANAVLRKLQPPILGILKCAVLTSKSLLNFRPLCGARPGLLGSKTSSKKIFSPRLRAMNSREEIPLVFPGSKVEEPHVFPEALAECDGLSDGSKEELSWQDASVSLLTLALLAWSALPAFADEASTSSKLPFGMTGSPLEILLLSSPILLYGLFNVFRAFINPRAKWSDFVFLAAAVLVLGNIFSIIVFKIRFF